MPLAASGCDYEMFGNAMAANGKNKVWECYVAGLDPTNGASRFETRIEMRGGAPYILWHPDLTGTGEARAYTIWGKTNITDVMWHTPTNSASRFFRVEVDVIR